MQHTQMAIHAPAAPSSSLQLAWTILVEPAKAFASLKEKPSYWFPLLASLVAFSAFFVVYYSVVDFAWLTDHLLSAQPKELSETGKAAAAEALSKNFLLWTSLITVVAGTPVLRALEALYYLLGGRATGNRLSFAHWMSLACWSAWPLMLLVVVMFISLAMHGNGQVAQDQVNMLSLNELFFHTKAGTPWHSLLSTLTLLHPWVWALTVLGVRAWSGRSLGYSAVFALIPVLLVYGGWALVSAMA